NIANAGRTPATDFLGWWEIGQVRTMAFTGVHDLQPGGAPCGQPLAVRCDSAAELRDIIAEEGAETAGFQEIALHVDDQQRAVCRDKLERIRFGLDRRSLGHIHCGKTPRM